MQTEQILVLLIAERDRLSRAIDALQSGAKRRGRPPRNNSAVQTTAVSTAAPARRRRGHMNPAQRKAQSERMKAFWAQRRKAKAKA